MKITIISAVTETLANELSSILDVAKKAKHPETEVDMLVLGKGLTQIDDGNYYSYHLFCETTMVRGIYEAQMSDIDAILLACFYDPALLAVRGISKIPVIGGGEASMHLACTMGEKFAVIVPFYEISHIVHRNIINYGLERKVIDHWPIRHIPPMDWGASMDPARITDEFIKTARECIAEGAEVLVLGCWGWTAVLTAAGIYEVDGVPLVDPCIAGIKFAEMMADLKTAGLPWISRKSMYQIPPEEKTKAFLSQF
jgi:allantoin racemase